MVNTFAKTRFGFKSHLLSILKPPKVFRKSIRASRNQKEDDINDFHRGSKHMVKQKAEIPRPLTLNV